jgi:type VI secretion system protein VasG
VVAINLKALVGRLSDVTRRQVEAAAGLTLSRTHYNVEIEHLLLRLVETSGSDVAVIIRKLGVDVGRVVAELSRTLDGLRTGNSRAPSLSPDVVAWMREAWLIASLEASSPEIRSGHLLAALLFDETLSRRLRESAPSLASLPAETVRRDLATLAAESEEAAAQPGATSEAGVSAPAGKGGLEQFCIDLTAQARKGGIDPILGRDAEIRQMIDILMRRRQNNPILTGEAGVGKTAVVEGLAQRVATGDVPEILRQVRILTLDLGLLQAGAGVKGEFENRLKGVVEAAKASAQPVILFIDEAHTLIGAGGQAGQNDAANLLKPALARGELRCIAATTWSEYKRYFEKDAALTRRFQVIKVEEPPPLLATAMLRGLVPVLERHHGVRILSDAVEEAVRLSARYIPARQLPDKAVSLLDTACARVGVSQSTVPPAIEDQRRRATLIAAELAALDREAAVGADHAARRSALDAEAAEVASRLESLEGRWRDETALVQRLLHLRRVLEEAGTGFEAERSELASTAEVLQRLQGEYPLIHPMVDRVVVADVVESWTGIPVGRMVSNEIEAVLSLRQVLEQRIIGQPGALEAVAQAMRVSRAGLTDPRKPIGVFLFAGTSGVGKTETALALAEALYGGEQNLTVINMSEFKEEHKVSLLMGSPPGYVGYGEGGVLTEAVRRRPYSVVLLDEMEKAHPGVQDVFYQVFDKGQMKDGEGRDIDFRNTVIIMTSNAGSDLITKLCADPETMPEPTALAEALRPELLKVFKPAFLGRCNITIFYPLADEVLRGIATLQLGRIARRLQDAYGAQFEASADIADALVQRCKETESGARTIEALLNRSLLPEFSARILERMAAGESIGTVHVSLDAEGQFAYLLGAPRPAGS